MEKKNTQLTTKISLSILGVIFALLGAFLNHASNYDDYRIKYKNIFKPRLGDGIDQLFQVRNKYIRPNAKELCTGDLNYFSLQKSEGTKFEEVKKFILSYSHIPDLDGDKVMVITQWQKSHIGNDPQHPDFTFRPIVFILEKPENKGIDFKKVSDDIKSKMIASAYLITDQATLTQKLDDYFSNIIKTWGISFIALGAILNGIAVLGCDKIKSGLRYLLDFYYSLLK